jgi:hypothetical protein
MSFSRSGSSSWTRTTAVVCSENTLTSPSRTPLRRTTSATSPVMSMNSFGARVASSMQLRPVEAPMGDAITRCVGHVGVMDHSRMTP